METKNIILRNVLEADLSIFYEHQLDEDAARMAEFPSRDYAAFMGRWKKIMHDQENILKTILFNGQTAGNIVSWEQEGEREVGYWLGRDFWGQGIATAALTEFLVFVKTRPLYGYVAKQNAASRLAGKMGRKLCWFWVQID